MTDPPPCLMRYRFSTVPTPLQASPSSALAPGMINVWAAPESGQLVYCSSVVIAVPVGDDVHDFARAAPTVTPNTQLWAVSSSRIGDGEDLGLPLGTYAIFTATTTAEHYLIDYQLVFSMITDSMSRHADTFSYIVVERSSTDPAGPMVQRRNTYTLAKAAPTLYLDDFVAVSPSAAKTTQPRTAFDNSESIKLEWASNASSFALYAGATAEPLWTGADTSYTLTSGLVNDTTVTLLATLDGLSVSATIALTVVNPTMKSGSVAAGSITAQSLEATGGASLADAAVGGVLTVAGRAALGAMTTSAAAVSGATVLADATLSGATISGALTARTSTRLGAVTSPSVTIASSCGMFAVRQVTTGVTYAASTDGLVVGSVREGPRGSSCAARIWATCSATGSGYAMGGVACVYQGKTESITWGNQNFFAPAGAGPIDVLGRCRPAHRDPGAGVVRLGAVRHRCDPERDSLQRDRPERGLDGGATTSAGPGRRSRGYAPPASERPSPRRSSPQRWRRAVRRPPDPRARAAPPDSLDRRRLPRPTTIDHPNQPRASQPRASQPRANQPTANQPTPSKPTPSRHRRGHHTREGRFLMTDTVEPFYLNNLLARVPGTTTPLSQFANGAPIELTWASNGTAYTVYAANDAEPVWSGTTTTCQLPGRTNTTTYVLAASVTGGPVSGTPDPSYSTILLYDAITVTITDPALTPLSLTTGSLTVSGATKVTGPATLADTTVGGTLSVTGAGSFGGGASATGLTVTGTTTLAGGATLSSAVVNGALSVTSAATLASTLVDALSISGSITMMNPQSITPGVWRTASTDGLLVGAVWFGSNAGKLCSAQINGYADGIGWVYATGGNTAVNGNTMWGNANTFTVPVRRGTGFQTNVWQIDGKELDAPTAFFWVPFARNSTLTELTPEEVAALEIEVPLIPTSYVERWDARPAVDDLVSALLDLAGDDAPSEAAAELTAAVMALATHED